MGVCCCLQTCKHASDGGSTWEKFDGHIYYLPHASSYNYAKVSPLYNVIWECIVIVYKDIDRSLHFRSPDHICLQNFRPVPLTVFEILGFKLMNKNNDKKKRKNWRNRLFAISSMFVVQFSPNINCTYILTLAVILWCQRWIITESECVNPKFPMYSHNGPRPHPSLYYTKYYHTL